MSNLVYVVVDNNLDYHINLFLEFKRAIRAPRTVEWYTRVLHYYRQEVGDSAWPPTAHHLLQFFKYFDRHNLGEYSRDNYYRAIRAFFNWCEQAGFIADNPIRLVDAPPIPHPLPRAPDQIILQRLFRIIRQAGTDNWHYIRDLALFAVALDTGIRISELHRLTVDQIDLCHGEIVIYATKTHTGRTLVLGDRCAADLGVWLIRRLKLAIPIDLPRVFVSNYQRHGFIPWSARGMRTRLRYWQDRAGIEPFCFNSFRHAYAIYSLRNGADLLDIKEQLGHKSIKTTAIYTMVVDKDRWERHRKTSPWKSLNENLT